MRPDGTAGLRWRLRYRYVPLAGSRVRRAWATGTNPHASVSFGQGCRLGPGFHLEVPGRGRFVAGAGVDFRRSFVCEIGGTGEVEIGDGCVFTYGVVIQCSTSVVIGAGCTLAAGVLVVDGSHRFRDHTRPMRSQGYEYRPISIAPGASVMANCTVLADIGEGAFVGTGSVVTEQVPAHCLAVGAPARVVEHFGAPEQRPAGLDPAVPSTGR